MRLKILILRCPVFLPQPSIHPLKCRQPLQYVDRPLFCSAMLTIVTNSTAATLLIVLNSLIVPPPFSTSFLAVSPAVLRAALPTLLKFPKNVSMRLKIFILRCPAFLPQSSIHPLKCRQPLQYVDRPLFYSEMLTIVTNSTAATLLIVLNSLIVLPPFSTSFLAVSPAVLRVALPTLLKFLKNVSMRSKRFILLCPAFPLPLSIQSPKYRQPLQYV
jgi:hypothetical protein